MILKKLLCLIIFLLTYSIASAQCSEDLTNGHFDASPETGWTKTLTNATADIVAVSASVFPGQQHGGADAIVFSHMWASQTQTIDLLAKGHSAAYLDNSPKIDVSEWYKGTAYADPNFLDEYYYKAELLDASDTVIASFEFGTQAAPKICSATWQQVSHSFTGYATGVRKIRITHGGNDIENWAGNFGPMIDDSSVCVEVVVKPCTDKLVNGNFDASPSTGWTETLTNPAATIIALSTSLFPGQQRTGADAIIFSYAWASQTQTIDLVAAGYTTTYLDMAPQISVSEWYKGASANVADQYYYKAELLDASDAVITSFEFGTQAVPKICTADWQQASHLFAGYGTGVRKVRITHGGKDAEVFGGNYGTIIDDSTVCIADLNEINTFTAASGNWNTPANWSLARIPISSDNVDISNKTVDLDISGVSVNDLSISSGGTLNIPSNNSLTIGGNLTQNGTFTINSGGSLIAMNTATGNVTYNRSINFVSGDLKGWYLMAAPVAGEGYDDAYVTANDIAVKSSNRGIATYTTSSDSWAYHTGGASGTFNSGQGYSIKRGTSTGNVSFTGTINNSNAGVDVTLSNSGNRFNALGNPYTSYISSATFLNDEASQSDTKTLWVWNQAMGTNGAYEVKTVGDNLMIAPGQGFFVKANAAGGTFNFKESNQTHNGGTDTFQKSSKKEEIILSITDGTIHQFAKIYYLENATKGLDIGYDGELFNGTSNPFAVYSHLISDNNGKNYQIQSLPNSDLESMVIPLGLNASSGKEITFSAESTNLPTDFKVFLEDRATDTFTPLGINSNYKVTLNSDLNGIGRFYLHTSKSALGIKDNALGNINVYKADKNTLRVLGLQNNKTTIKIFNILGKQVVNTSFIANGVKDIILPKLATGVYVVKLQTNKGELNKKIILE